MKHTTSPLLFTAYLLLAACSDEAKEEANENNAVWSTYASGSYEYDILELCNCPSPDGFHTIVIDGEIFSTIAIGSDINADNNPNPITTMEQLFDIAGQYGVKTTYNNQYGYPERIEITPTDTTNSASFGNDTSGNSSPPYAEESFTAGFEVQNFSLIETF